MRPSSESLRAWLRLAFLSTALLVFTGNCTLGPLQALVFHFTVDDTVAAGSNGEVHKAFYPVGVTLKKYFVRVSGTVDTKGAAAPNKIAVTIDGEDQVTGKRNQKVSLNVTVKADGSFTATKRIKKNIPAGTVQTISARPTGAAIPAGSDIWICIDIAKKKSDFTSAAACDMTSGPTPSVAIVEVLDNFFEPKQLTIQPGDTVRWVLRGNRSNHTTTDLNAAWDSDFIFVQNGDLFERTFPQAENGQTFMYRCRAHQDCCQMQGSIRVGNDAPDPAAGF